MTTLLIRKTGGKAKRALTFAGEGGWAVTAGDEQLATARTRTTTSRLDIESGGRALTADMPGHDRPLSEKRFTVEDGATGEVLIEGTRIPEGDPRFPVREKWALRFADGRELAWMYKEDPRELGFYDADGNPVMVIGHHVAFDPAAGGGTLRILFRMWGAAGKSTEEYAAQFDDQALTSVVPAGEAPILALLGMWLERRWDVKGRGSDASFAG